MNEIAWIENQLNNPKKQGTEFQQKREEKKLIEKLIKIHKFNANVIVDEQNTTLLMFVVQKKLVGLAKPMIHSSDTDLSLKDDDGYTAFSHAIYGGQSMMIKEFALCNKVNFSDEFTKRAFLNYLSVTRNVTASYLNEIFKIDKFCINFQDRNGCTALMFVSMIGPLECLKVILKHKNINVNLKNGNNETAFMMAIKKKRPQIVKELLGISTINLEVKSYIMDELKNSIVGKTVLQLLNQERKFTMSWEAQKILWIGVYKKQTTNSCFLSWLPREIMKIIIQFAFLPNRNSYVIIE